MTERLYYADCYLNAFRASVAETAEDGKRVYLDRTAFYPTSGGQPFDLGTIGGVAVREVVDEEDRIAHLMERPLAVGEVEAAVDWTRRYDHMQQHTGQHLLSAVCEELFKMPTLSFHMGAEVSTIELGASSLDAKQTERIERRCAEIAAEARPVVITYEDASADLDLRKASSRSGTLRIITIEGIDRSACGGTHVRSTSETAPILIRKLEKIRGNTRIEFVCGQRALHQARQDYATLAAIGRALSAPLESTPALVTALSEKGKALEKTCQRLASELAVREGRELYASTVPSDGGLRRASHQGQIDETIRVRAQSFVSGGKAVFLAVCYSPPSILLAASADSGIHAGEKVKTFVTSHGGRGGGNQTLAQGSLPSAEALDGAAFLIR